MSIGLLAARRISLTLAALVLISLIPAGPIDASANSRSLYDRLGHGYLGLDTNLRSPSHISAWSIDAYLAQQTVLPPLGHAFKSAEQKYDVNALYLLAHAMHETAFGTSFISLRYRNLFGWNAADRDPVALATRFRSYAASIDFVSSQVSTLYLTDSGKWWGGAPTLRGMRYYASDPHWAQAIVDIANSIVLPTLSSRKIRFATPKATGPMSTGTSARVTVATSAGSLPDGLRAAYRFVPVAVVEAGSRTGAMPKINPSFKPAIGSTKSGRLTVKVDAPTRPGRYRLELALRDSDGSILTEYGVPSIPPLAVRVYGSDAVTYTIAQSSSGIGITVKNVGRRLIEAGDTTATEAALAAGATAAAAGATGSGSAVDSTVLSAWLIRPDGGAIPIATVPLGEDLAAGKSWTTHLPAALLEDVGEGVLLVRLQVAGAPNRLGGSPPGVFMLSPNEDADAASLSEPGPGGIDRGPASSDAPAAQAGASPGALVPATPPSESAGGSPGISITAVTPVDTIPVHALARKVQGRATARFQGFESSKSVSPSIEPVIDVAYSETFDAAAGAAIVHVTNIGHVTITAGPAPAVRAWEHRGHDRPGIAAGDGGTRVGSRNGSDRASPPAAPGPAPGRKRGYPDRAAADDRHRPIHVPGRGEDRPRRGRE